MNKILFVLYLLASLLFIACGESHLAEAQEPLRSFAVIVPEKYAGNIDNYPIQSQIYIEQNQTLKFYLATIKDGIQNFGEDAYPYFKNVLWDIDGDNSNLPTIKHSFKRTGLVTGSLRLVDLWDDTTTHQFEFLVNTPQTISIDFPYDGYNQVNPLNNQSLPLRWSITGIDPWEQASCEIFASREKKEVWNSPIAKVDCFDKVTLRGSLVGIDLAETYDSSFSFYWAVKSTVSSLYASPVNDSTNIARFSTKILDTLSQIQISFRYLNYHASEIPKTKISVIAFNGDTLSTQYSFKKQDSIKVQIRPQSDVKIQIQSVNRSDYAPESLIVNVPQNTVEMLEPIYLRDVIKPQVAPQKDTVSIFAPIKFYLYDDGAGIDIDKLHVIVNYDTIPVTYSEPEFSFVPTCIGNCQLQVIGQDYERNTLPDVYWNIVTKGSVTTIQGPFVKGGY